MLPAKGGGMETKMKKVQLSMEEIINLSGLWAREISISYHPDCIVYVAKAGFLIGREFARWFEVPLIGISAARSGNSTKKRLSNIAKHFPEKIKDMARMLEMKVNIHKMNADRNIFWIDDISTISWAKCVLLVDDSVDTGNTIIAVRNSIMHYLPDATIKVASLNVWSEAEKKVSVDFYKYTDTILKTPMSNDSRDHQTFLHEYEKAVERNVRNTR